MNAPLLAAERGIAVRLVTDPESPDHRNLITMRGTLADGSQFSVSGTLVGINQRERLVEVNGFVVDLEPTEHLAFFRYEDRPGMVGTVGQILGEANVNIAGMQVARDEKGGKALVALSVDSAIPAETLAEIEQAIDAVAARAIDLQVDFNSGLVLNKGMTLVLGVDSSTQSTKALLVDADDGTVVGQGSAPHPGGTEVDPRAWLAAVDAASSGLLERADTVAIGGQQHGLVALADNGEPVRDALLWNNTGRPRRPRP